MNFPNHTPSALAKEKMQAAIIKQQQANYIKAESTDNTDYSDPKVIQARIDHHKAWMNQSMNESTSALDVELARIGQSGDQPDKTVLSFNEYKQFINEKVKEKHLHSTKSDLEKEREKVKRQPTPEHIKNSKYDHEYKEPANKDNERKKHEQKPTL